MQVDDVAPILTIPADQLVNSTGPETMVSLGMATAEDFKDGAIVPTVDQTGPFTPGHHIITWRADDQAGNTATAQQVIDVTPMATFEVAQMVDEGTTAQVNVLLNGSAVTYPVTIPFTVSGTAQSGVDHDLTNGNISIESGVSATIDVSVQQDDIPEGLETIVVEMGTPTNAIQGSIISHTLTIIGANIAPRVSIDIIQDAQSFTTVTKDAGVVQLTANVIDLNSKDQHTYDWSLTSGELVPAEGFSSPTFTFDPAALTEGLFTISVTVTDNGEGSLSGSVDSLVKVIASAPVLNDDIDTDGDGIDDEDEGFSDVDMDRIPDYLDPIVALNQLPASDNTNAILQSDAGTALSLGSTAFASGNNNASVSVQNIEDHGGLNGAEGTNTDDGFYKYSVGIYDFEVKEPESGSSVRIVLPQTAAISSNSLYRKYETDSGWSGFIEDMANSIASAPGTLGVCPSPGDVSYVSGLSEGHYCVQLTIEDGGPNDADDLANGLIKYLGGVAANTSVNPTVSITLKELVDNVFNVDDGEKVVLRFELNSSATGATLNKLTIGSGGDIHEVNDIGAATLYVDANNNGVPEASEKMVAERYRIDDGEIEFSAPYPLPTGITGFLVTYQF